MRIGRRILALPGLLILSGLFVGGLASGLAQSLGYLPAAGLRAISLDAYAEVVRYPGFLHSLGLTVFVASAATLLSVVLAIVTAFALRRALRGGRMLGFVYQLPLTVPHLVVAVGTLMLISQSGLFARVAFHLGVIGEPADFPVMVYDDFGLGVIFVYVWKQVPFIGLIILSVLQSAGEDYEEVARSLGANRRRAFFHVLLPLVVPGILPGSIIIFAYVFGSFEVPLLLGKSYPAMLSVFAYQAYVDVDLDMRPMAMATAMLIALFCFLLITAYRAVALRVVRR